VLLGGSVLAEVSIAQVGSAEIYTQGRVDAFLSTGWGTDNPIPFGSSETLRPVAALDIHTDAIPKVGPNGSPVQGTFESMRIRSGTIPNVFGFGVRRAINDQTVLTVYLAYWATIEADGQGKTTKVAADARDGYLKIEGPWGSALAGRAEDLFSRGASENDILYGHGYGVGFPGNIDSNGPALGLISFGVMATFSSPGFVYTTPKASGLQLAVGLYDPAPIEEIYDATRFPRPEAELTYDLSIRRLRIHLFANGEYQRIYRDGGVLAATSWGVGYGGRFEIGGLHLGVAGDYGPGLGLGFALEPDPVSVTASLKVRTFDGYSAFLQYSTSRLDVNLGVGISRAYETQEDVDDDISVLKQEIGYSAGVVYHLGPSVHYDVDVLRGAASWYLGERQVFTFVNAGVTATW
jgi:hypothetical protein